MVERRLSGTRVSGRRSLWRTVFEHPKTTTLTVLFALTLALAAFGLAVEYTGPIAERLGP
jgi:hypothetical protein